MQNTKRLSMLSALCAQFIFGFSFMFTKIALGYASPITVIADRYIVAFATMTIVVLFKKIKLKPSKNIFKLVLMSIFQPVLYFLCESYGIKLTTSGFSSVMISLIPIVSIFAGIIFLKEIPSLMQYVFTFVSVLGVVIMVYSGKADGTVTVWGVVLLMGAVVSSVLYNVLSRKISKEFTALERTYAMMLIGLVVFASISFAENFDNPANVIASFKHPLYTVSVLYLGAVSSVAAFLLLNYANTHLPVSKTTVFSNITTLVSVAAGIVFLDEKLSVVTVISAIMIIAGVWGVQLTNKY